MEESLKSKISEYREIIKKASIQIEKANKSIHLLQKQCPHKNLEHFSQDYAGRWSNCKDCGKEDV